MSRRDKRLERRRKWQRKMEIRSRGTGSEPVAMLPPGLVPIHCDITFEPMKGEYHNGRSLAQILPDDDDRANLFDRLHEQPREMIPQLEALAEKHPDCPPLLNWLAMAYVLTDNQERFDEITRLSFERHPEYLFARLNYIQSRIDRGDMDRATELWDRKFHLKLMYPERNVFHITELGSFCQLAIHYFLKLGRIDAARGQLHMIEQVAPESSYAKKCRAMIAQHSLPKAMAGLLRLMGQGRRGMA